MAHAAWSCGVGHCYHCTDRVIVVVVMVITVVVGVVV